MLLVIALAIFIATFLGWLIYTTWKETDLDSFNALLAERQEKDYQKFQDDLKKFREENPHLFENKTELK